MRKCIDCGFWFSFNSCRECGKPLCSVCVDWPSPRLLSPGKGLCTACREKPKDIRPPVEAEENHVIPSRVVSQLAAMFLEEALRAGREIEIPSLGIKVGKDGTFAVKSAVNTEEKESEMS